ncbi:MAG TPA: periplasmic heavy metal sensor [Polyangiaceae bacterium]|nr:periplasmic heavy metal sensor [Polyangiaceae bacterium]
MIGFVIGTLCLVGLVKVLRRGRVFGGPFAYGGCGPGGYGGGAPGFGFHGHHGDYRDRSHDGDGDTYERGGGADWGGSPGPRGWGRWGGWAGQHGRRFFLRGLFERLDTTPGQEKAILAALDDLQAASKNVKDELRGARSEVASAMRGASFDEVALGGATARVEHGIDTMRRAGIDAFAKIHEALDERQRNQLADWLERGPRGFGRY